MPKVSVLMPCYNAAATVEETMQSITAQTHDDFEVVVNSSLIETLGRSLNTSLTTLFVVLALLFFVGSSIQNFAVVLLVGIIAGTFSSLFIAPPLLVVWEKGEWGRFVRWLPIVGASGRTKNTKS